MGRGVADTNTEDEAAAADLVDERGCLGHLHGVPEVDRLDRCPEGDRLGYVRDSQAQADGIVVARAVDPGESALLDLAGELERPEAAARDRGERNGRERRHAPNVTRVPISYEVHPGEGPFCLFVHGMLSSRSHWLPNLESLAEVCRPVVVELYGHGHSPSPQEEACYSPRAYVAEFERIRFDVGADAWLVCGHSLGAALTVRYALDCPERVIKHVFTNSNSALADADWVGRVSSQVRFVAAAIEARGKQALTDNPLHPSQAKRMPAAVKAALVRDSEEHDPRGIALTMLHTVPASPVRDRIGENRVPALLTVGRREAAFAAHALYAANNMPLLEVVELDAGHAVNIQDADGFNAAVAGFFKIP